MGLNVADRAYGIDVSHHQETVDWTKVAGAGISFAYAKASEGMNADPLFPANWAGMKAAGVIRGAYHFFRPKTDPAAQASHFCALVGALDPADLPPMVDLEPAGLTQTSTPTPDTAMGAGTLVIPNISRRALTSASSLASRCR